MSRISTHREAQTRGQAQSRQLQQGGASMVNQRNQFVDTFVKHDGRWLMIKSDVTILK